MRHFIAEWGVTMEQKKPYIVNGERVTLEEYRKTKYEDLRVRVPIGQKDAIKARADSLGMSLNAFITKAIDHSLAYWAERDEKLPPGKQWCKTEEGKAAIARLRNKDE